MLFLAAYPEESPPEPFYIRVIDNIPAPKLIVPPISFIAVPASDDGNTGPGFRLLFDFFQNNWTVPSAEQLARSVPIPTIVYMPVSDDEDDEDEDDSEDEDEDEVDSSVVDSAADEDD